MTERADIQSVLSQMRSLQAQVQSSVAKPAAPVEASEELPSFGDMLKQAMESVNSQQTKASQMSKAYEMGDPNVDLPQVMIELQKASVSFQAMTQVRNKLLEAYKEIMNMPV
ncbi:flagellar hook-basal body complex protein FliE [Balneatrix alpica]|uniref:Flagellar hook-basal body complex protein FliE n=1 Tax=Balneatrix alpica TaxID=75684 RepID=A0ABV5ZE65_9GAMM|nr:flagellar hook-basal body complex protein FliE [Balneatrix alpica]